MSATPTSGLFGTVLRMTGLLPGGGPDADADAGAAAAANRPVGGRPLPQPVDAASPRVTVNPSRLSYGSTGAFSPQVTQPAVYRQPVPAQQQQQQQQQQPAYFPPTQQTSAGGGLAATSWSEGARYNQQVAQMKLDMERLHQTLSDTTRRNDHLNRQLMNAHRIITDKDKTICTLQEQVRKRDKPADMLVYPNAKRRRVGEPAASAPSSLLSLTPPTYDQSDAVMNYLRRFSSPAAFISPPQPVTPASDAKATPQWGPSRVAAAASAAPALPSASTAEIRVVATAPVTVRASVPAIAAAPVASAAPSKKEEQPPKSVAFSFGGSSDEKPKEPAAAAAAAGGFGAFSFGGDADAAAAPAAKKDSAATLFDAPAAAAPAPATGGFALGGFALGDKKKDDEPATNALGGFGGGFGGGVGNMAFDDDGFAPNAGSDDEDDKKDEEPKKTEKAALSSFSFGAATRCVL